MTLKFVFVKTWTLSVDEGQRINITFLHFDVRDQTTCSWDWVELNSDNLISRHCGQTSQPWTIIFDTNNVTVTFSSDGFDNGLPGFLAVWTATTEPPTYPSTLADCANCDFPFAWGDGTFDTCISVLDVDTQPWCSPGPPTIEGTHIYPKISCSDNDSSCPSSPSQTVITSLDYPQSYPNNAYQVKLIHI